MVLYPQNGDRIVSIDSVTLLHLMVERFDVEETLLFVSTDILDMSQSESCSKVRRDVFLLVVGDYASDGWNLSAYSFGWVTR